MGEKKYRVRINNPVIGVPITFLDKYSPEQFEILDINPHFFTEVEQGRPKPTQLKIAGQKDPYARLLIRWKPEAMPNIDEDGVIIYDDKQKGAKHEN